MLTDAGIRVPFIVHWPRYIPEAKVLNEPVSSLDAIYTALKAAGAGDNVLGQLDGTDLLPALTADPSYLNQRPLFWRFWSQSAVLLGDWKYVRVGDTTEYLFQTFVGELPENNQLSAYPDTTIMLKALLEQWEQELPGARAAAMNTIEQRLYDYWYDAAF